MIDDPRLEQRPEAQLDAQQHLITIILTEDQAEAMASGYVPRSVKSILRELLDYELEDLRRSERPVAADRQARRVGTKATRHKAP